MNTIKQHSWIRPAVGALVATAITTAVSVSGLSTSINALTLIPLFALFWMLEHFTRVEMGFVWGRLRHYGLAILYPVTVLGLVALAAWISGAINVQAIDWLDTVVKSAITILVTILLAVITEEGFFRGWLWASLKRAGQNPSRIIIWTSLVFAVWHLPVAFINPEFALPLAQIPVYILNVAVAGGVIFGLLRLITGSVIVASVSHGIWNGIAYTFFGSGTLIGALGIQETAIFGPEVGVLGLILNIGFAIGLWLWYRRGVKLSDANRGLLPIPGAPSPKII